MTPPETPWGVISAFAGVWMVAIAAVASWMYSKPTTKKNEENDD